MEAESLELVPSSLMEGPKQEELTPTPEEMTPTPEASVENMFSAEEWATLPDIHRKRLQNIYNRHMVMQQMGEHFYQRFKH